MFVMRSLLEKSADPNVIRRQDEGTVIFYISLNVNSRDLLLNYMEENWQMFLDKYGTASFTLPDIVESVTQNLNTKYHLKRIEEFIENNELAVAAEAFNQAIENIKINMRWLQNNLAPVKQWLIENTKMAKIK